MRLFGKDLGKKDFLRVCYFMLAVIILKIISNFVLPERKLLLEPTTAGCLPWDLYLWVGQKDKPVEFARYDLVAFPARKMAPYVPDGTNIGKMVAGLPGDTVEIRLRRGEREQSLAVPLTLPEGGSLPPGHPELKK